MSTKPTQIFKRFAMLHFFLVNCASKFFIHIRCRCNYWPSFFNRYVLGPKSSTFYSTIKPFLSNKAIKSNNNIILYENEKIVNDPKEVSEIFNIFFYECYFFLVNCASKFFIHIRCRCNYWPSFFNRYVLVNYINKCRLKIE
jgi:hypothetical protein